MKYVKNLKPYFNHHDMDFYLFKNYKFFFMKTTLKLSIYTYIYDIFMIKIILVLICMKYINLSLTNYTKYTLRIVILLHNGIKNNT
jgi:hypothetical protein